MHITLKFRIFLHKTYNENEKESINNIEDLCSDIFFQKYSEVILKLYITL